MTATGQVVTSAANPVVKRMRMLASRKFRQREGLALAEGIQPVWQAVEAGAPVEALVYAPDLLRYQPAVEMVLDAERRGVRVVRLSGDLFQRLSDRDGAAGLAAIVGQRLTPLGELPAGPGTAFVALHEIASPGNLGTVIRTADAAGVRAVILVGATADPYDPAAIKASMGAIFSVPVARAAGSDEFFAWAGERDLAVVTTSARATQSVWEARYPDPLVVLMGSEGPGLADADLRRGRLQVSIPMTGTAESLNLAVATGVVLFEVVRQRRERAVG
jgi:RNA methyltransferase, TrmH family